MPVTASTHQRDSHTQADGTRYVRETHTLSVGAPIVIHYGPVPDAFDADAAMTTRAADIDEQLAAAEFEQIIDGP